MNFQLQQLRQHEYFTTLCEAAHYSLKFASSTTTTTTAKRGAGARRT